MKKRLLLQMTALPLALLLLLTGCVLSARVSPSSFDVRYDQMKAEDYVALSEDAFRALVVDVDRMKVDEEDVTAYIKQLLYDEYKTEYPDSTGKDQPGMLSKHDVITYRTFVYDRYGNLVQQNFSLPGRVTVVPNEEGAITSTFINYSEILTQYRESLTQRPGSTAIFPNGSSKLPVWADSAITDGNTVPVRDPSVLPLGYGINEGFSAKIEQALLESGVRFENVHLRYNNLCGARSYGLATVPEVGYLTYNSTVITENDSTSGKGDPTVKPVHFVPYMNKTEQGENDFMEAIYLGLKQVIERQYALGEPLEPSETVSDVITINVYPVGELIPMGAVTTATSAYINYNLDFSGDLTSAKAQRGTIKVSLKGAITMVLEEGAAFKTTYSFPDDATGDYKNAKGETLKIKDAKDCEVYVYVESRQQYTCPEYNSDFILNTLKFETELTDEVSIIAAHRESIRKQLQDECDEAARADAIEQLWKALSENAELINKPLHEIREYVDFNMAWYKHLYYEPNAYFPNGAKNYKSSTGVLVFDDFDDFLTSYYVISDDDGTTITFQTEEEVESHLRQEGTQIVKEGLLAYLLADRFEVRYTEEELHAELIKDATVHAKDAIAHLREEYNNASLEELRLLKDLYGFADASEIPDDLYTWEDCMPEELGEAYFEIQRARVLDAVYEIKATDGTLCFNDIDYAS